MRILETLLVTLLMSTGLADAQNVSNVRALELTDGTGRIEVLYDLSGATGAGAVVTVVFSNDDGVTFGLTPDASALSGDKGNGIGNGTNKRILWDLKKSYPAGLCGAKFRAKVTADSAGQTYALTVTKAGTGAGTVTSNPSGINCGATCIATFGSGTQVTLTAAANSGSTFAGWGGACTGTGTCTVTMDAAKNVVATFDVQGSAQEITVTLPGNVPLVMVKIPKGTFWMGSPETERNRQSDEMRHQVTLSQDYYMGKYAVTQGQWQAVMGTAMRTDCGSYGTEASYPVYCVSWDDITGSGGFVEKLNAHLTSTGQAGAGEFGLPTEAQWERAARAGTDTRFSFGDALDSDDECGASAQANPYMWWCGNAGRTSHPVGTKQPNRYGLYDMHGHLFEWAQDWYGAYPSGSVTDPVGPGSGSSRVSRGGYWNGYLRSCRSAIRGGNDPGFRFSFIGLRLSRSADSGAQTYALTVTKAGAGAGTVTSNPSGIDCGATCTATFSSGTQVTLTAAPAQGSTFAGWGGACTGTGTCTVTMDAAKSVTATFDVQGLAQEITVTLPGNVPLVLVKIPKGTFWMGSPETERSRGGDETRHQVTLSQDYYMGKYAVTQGQWKAVVGSNPSYFSSCGDNCPVEQVSWNDIAGSGGFLEKLNAYLTSTGQAGAGKYRLPTEAEWERAARAGTDTRFSFGDALDSDDQCGASAQADAYVWWCANADSKTHAVGGKNANGYGLYDMHGNVWQWVQDWFGSYGAASQTDPTGAASGSSRVNRGGGWYYGLLNCRSANRDNYLPDGRYFLIGLRLSRSQ